MKLNPSEAQVSESFTVKQQCFQLRGCWKSQVTSSQSKAFGTASNVFQDHAEMLVAHAIQYKRVQFVDPPKIHDVVRATKKNATF
jgi:hypothetical protein